MVPETTLHQRQHFHLPMVHEREDEEANLKSCRGLVCALDSMELSPKNKQKLANPWFQRPPQSALSSSSCLFQ
jgi:hypothetical protein